MTYVSLARKTGKNRGFLIQYSENRKLQKKSQKGKILLSYADVDADLSTDADAVTSPDANADSDGERMRMRRLRTHTATTMGASSTEPEPESRMNEWEMANGRRDEVRARRRHARASAGREECRIPLLAGRVLGTHRTHAIDDESPRKK
ncbi:hypothetical protein DFH09DRAFT_1102772 [Mycena vulgaris]|nr:hypothetical protein DFH09DRAFT_1102772 [Mycena vulgaris]